MRRAMRCHEALRPSPPALPKRLPSVSCIPFLHRVSFRSRRQRLPGGASLFRAYRMGARACVCAGAVRAPDCPRASQAQGALLLSVPMGVFRAGAKRETKRPPDAASSCIILPRISQGQALTGTYFKLYEQIAASAPAASCPPAPALHPGRRPGPRSGAQPFRPGGKAGRPGEESAARNTVAAPQYRV